MISWEDIMRPIITRKSNFFRMKRAVILILIFHSLNAYSQSDTSLIRKALIYVNSEGFQKDLRDFTDKDIRGEILSFPNNPKLVKRYRNQRLAHMQTWLNAKCFSADTFYCVGILSTKRGNGPDSVWYRKFDTVFYQPYKIGCEPGLVLEPYLLANDVIELRFFEGSKGAVLFGETSYLRLELVGDKIKILKQDFIYNN